jgi:hypothetical protein
MNQTGRKTARSIMFAIVAVVIVFSVSVFLDGYLLQTAYATHPGHQLGSGTLTSEMTAQQLTTAVDAQAASTNADKQSKRFVYGKVVKYSKK